MKLYVGVINASLSGNMYIRLGANPTEINVRANIGCVFVRRQTYLQAHSIQLILSVPFIRIHTHSHTGDVINNCSYLKNGLHWTGTGNEIRFSRLV